jgi:hypothetical protein
MSSKISVLAGGAAVSLIFLQPVQAASVTVYNSSTAFDAATTNDVTSNFSNQLTDAERNGLGFGFRPNTDPLTINGIVFKGDPAGGVNINKALFNGSSDLPVDYLVNPFSPGQASTLTISFAATTAFALDFTTLFNPTNVTFNLSNGYSTSAVGPNYGSTPEFIGFVSSNPFTSITLNIGVCGTDSCPSWVVADVIDATAAVPEPSTWAMIILGFFGIGTMTYRRRKSAMLAA